MIESSLPARRASRASVLHVAEISHRIRNEYARAISFASLMAAKTRSQEAKIALGEMIEHLHAAADAHFVLSPPLAGGVRDLGETLTRLCQASARSAEVERRGITLFYSFEEPILIDAGICWRVALIVSELINNAFQQNFGYCSGNISIAVDVGPDNIVCKVSDDGSSSLSIEAGLGTQLADALAAEINGAVERQFNEYGTATTLSFPREA